ncbi:Glutathione S-transferase kappa 1, partial [Tolypocladium paradoxum]
MPVAARLASARLKHSCGTSSRAERGMAGASQHGGRPQDYALRRHGQPVCVHCLPRPAGECGQLASMIPRTRTHATADVSRQNDAVFQECDTTYVPIFLGGLMRACGNTPPMNITSESRFSASLSSSLADAGNRRQGPLDRPRAAALGRDAPGAHGAGPAGQLPAADAHDDAAPRGAGRGRRTRRRRRQAA